MQIGAARFSGAMKRGQNRSKCRENYFGALRADSASPTGQRNDWRCSTPAEQQALRGGGLFQATMARKRPFVRQQQSLYWSCNLLAVIVAFSDSAPKRRVRMAQIWKGSTFTIERKEGKAPGTVIFHLSGPFTVRNMFDQLSPAALHELFESQSGEAPTIHIFDMTDVPYMDSWGLSTIISQYVRCQARGLRMVVAGVSPRVLEWFRLTKLDTVIPMDTTVEEAEAHALRSPQPQPLHPDVLRFLGEGI
jgi:anti-anti-sigma factor